MTENTHNKKAQQFFRWDQNGFGVKPDIIRFTRYPFEQDLQIEFMMEGDLQGRLFETTFQNVKHWLSVRGIEWTWNLESAVDTVYEYLEVAYSPVTDKFLIMTD